MGGDVTAHTPGQRAISLAVKRPWHVRGQNTPEIGAAVYSAAGDCVCGGLTYTDARLIAAAPDLLKAAEAAVAYDEAIRQCGNDPDKMASHCTAEGDTLDSLYSEWMVAARVGIAKATA